MPRPSLLPDAPRADSRSAFINRLGYYALGVAIGLLIVGAIAQGKRSRSSAAPPRPATTTSPANTPPSEATGASPAPSAAPASTPAATERNGT